MRNAKRGSPNVEAGAACGHYGEPKLMNPERAAEWKNVRLCSPMFAYVRLTGKKMLRALHAAVAEWETPGGHRGHRGHRGCRHWGKRRGSRGRSPSQLRALRTAIADCKMHDMMKGRSQCGTAVEPS